MQIIILSCSREKKTTSDRAENLYCSRNFKNSLAISRQYADKIYVASAKHGLLSADDFIEPYDYTFINSSEDEKLAWSKAIREKLELEAPERAKLIFLTGKEYSSLLLNSVDCQKYNVFFPFKSRSDSYKSSWIEQIMPGSLRTIHLNQFYSIVDELVASTNDYVPFGSFPVDGSFPKKGLYLFFENGETRLFQENHLRVVRVGTHAVSKGSKSTLWTRLRTHKGTSTGIGNHRASIFRLHVGSAIINKHSMICDTWGKGQSATREIRTAEEHLEKLVSDYINKMSFLWLNIPGESSSSNDRSYIERNIIALIAGTFGPIDVGSENWLGYYSSNKAIRESSLWNVNYVSDSYDPRFLDVFYKYAMATIGKAATPTQPLAPSDWKSSHNSDQHNLF